MQKIEIGIEGMSCASCVGRIERALTTQPGVSAAHVNLATARATVEFDQPAILATLVRSIQDAGYQPRVQSAEVPVTGMTCGSCVSRVEWALNKQPGVIRASVNLTTQKAFVEFLTDALSLARIHQAIRDTGYEPQEPESSAQTGEEDKEGIDLRRKVIYAAALTIPVVLIAMGKMIPALESLYASVLSHRGWMAIEWLLTTPALFYAGSRFFRSGYAELRHANPGMNTLVMIGSSAAYFYSVAALLVPGFFPAGTAESYFEAAAVIVTLILLGRYFEHIAKGRTSEASVFVLTNSLRLGRFKPDSGHTAASNLNESGAAQAGVS
jgi:Cu+-exporting ATPase